MFIVNYFILGSGKSSQKSKKNINNRKADTLVEINLSMIGYEYNANKNYHLVGAGDLNIFILYLLY